MSPGLTSASPWLWPVHFQSSGKRTILSSPMRARISSGRAAGDQRMHVVAGTGLDRPVRMPVILNGRSGGENIFQLVLPAVPPLVSRQAIGHGAVGGLLQVKVEGGFNAQAGLVNLLRAEAFFELPPHLLLKPGRDGHHRLGNAQAQRRVASLLGLGVGDHLVVLPSQ